MENVAAALHYAIGYLNITKEQHSSLRKVVIFGPYHPDFTELFAQAEFVTPFAGQNAAWATAGHRTATLTGNACYDIAVLQAPQQKEETDYLIATALNHLFPNGILLIAADNQSGGKSLERRLAAFGCPTANLSKHKARVVWTTSPQTASEQARKAALAAGGIQQRPHDHLQSQPGIFSWDKRDKGTSVLLGLLPPALAGNGADLGCGLGEISKYCLETYPEIRHLTAIDHDRRAIACCKENIRNFAAKTTLLWQDIPCGPALSGLDFVVMNPPFHIGKEESRALGISFLRKAQQALRTGGHLYLVANTHLPYEEDLKSLFVKIETLGIDNGFKVMKATR